MSTFSKTILSWYSKNKRPLPWRKTKDPYKIWLSEIILQQTRVAQGLPYYEKFVIAYPCVEDLAAAKEEDILKLWQGLGYYSRARNLHATAKIVTSEFNGNFPSTYIDLLKLKGIGDYTASAIASICYNEARPVVDGNVYRVLARYYGIDLPINETKGIKYFKELAIEIMDAKEIADYNQGIMEFGAKQCTPQKPDCNSCPLSVSCVGLQQNKIKELPLKIKKGKIRKRYFNYLVLVDGLGNTLLNKRIANGIWKNLFEFPLIESIKLLEEQEVRAEITNTTKINFKNLFSWQEQPIIHKLSHQHIITTFWIVETSHELPNGIPLGKIEAYPVPVLMAEFIETFKNSYFWPKEIV
jgi:A/G-specific adenine glycosylase